MDLGVIASINMETSCGVLLGELEHIWTEIGGSDSDKDRMLLELEMECMQVYRKKVEEASNARARLQKSLMAQEAELATLIASLGEHTLHLQNEKREASLKDQLAFVTPLLEDLRAEKEERVKQFTDVASQIENIKADIKGYNHRNESMTSSLTIDGYDLSMIKLNEYQSQLRNLQKEKDENRYSAGRGSHLKLKRAEKARVTVTKIPAIVDSLLSRIFAWEDERNVDFLYDGVRLVSILEEYNLSRQQKEEENRRFRDQKKLQNLLLTEKELMYGSKPSPKRSTSFNRNANGNGKGFMTPSPRRVSTSGATPELLTPCSHSGCQNGYFREMRRLSTAPLNFVAISKEDAASSFASISGSEPGSPGRY